MAGGYVHNPKGAEGVALRIRKIERDLDRVRRAITHIGIQIDPDTNSLVVSSGRGIRVTDVAGNTVAIIGTQPGLERSDGSPQAGVSLYREDGSIAAFLGDSNPTVPPFKQSWQMYDRAGNVVMADDTNGGKGLAQPYVGGGCFLGDTNTAGGRRRQRQLHDDRGRLVSRPESAGAVGHPARRRRRDRWRGPAVVQRHSGRRDADGRDLVRPVEPLQRLTGWRGRIGWQFAHFELQARRTSGTGIVFGIVQRFQGDQTP
jgi:hypothetical protein